MPPIPSSSRLKSAANLAPDLTAALTANIEEIAQKLAVGRLVKRFGRRLEIGSNGSIKIELWGAKRGSWYSHEAQEGGGPIQLVQHLAGLDYHGAIAWARDFTGIAEAEQLQPRRRGRAVAPIAEVKAKAGAEVKDAARRAQYVGRLWNAAVPLSGTLAERYLIEIRGIPAPATGWSDNVRFHPGKNALIVAATNDAGAVQAVHAVYLTADARKTPGTPKQPAKQSFGPQDGAALRLPGISDGPVLFAEGPETGLSVWAATGFETRVAFGSIAKLTAPADRLIVVCRDDDAAHTPADKALDRAVRAWGKAGHKVTVATPWAVRQHDKSDFNDAMQAGGADAVRDRIEAAIKPDFVTVHRYPVAEARKRLDGAASVLFDAALAHDTGIAPVHAIKADVGIGKSHVARKRATELLTRLRASRDDRTVVLAVPTHRLGDEQAEAFEALGSGLVARVWRGREAPDPIAPGQAMCQDLAAVRDAYEVSADPQTTVCQSKVAGKTVECPFFSSCSYQAQRQAKADTWIVPHELLYIEKQATFGDVAAVIVDESSWPDGLIGATGRPLQLSLDTLTKADPIGRPGSLETQRLGYLRGLLHRALSGAPDGAVTRGALLDAGITEIMAIEAGRLEWKRAVDVKMRPGMSAEQRREAKAGAVVNKTLGRCNVMWKAVAALLASNGPAVSGWLELAHDDTEDGRTRVLRLKGRKPVSVGYEVPTLLIDATLQMDLIRPIWPAVVLTAEIAVASPNQHIIQVIDRTFSKRALVQIEGAADTADSRYRANNLVRLHAQICAMARRYFPGRVLVVAQKDVEASLIGLGNLPANLDLAHHNAVAGRDEWRDVDALVVVGRTQAPPAAVARIAEALTGTHIPALAGWYAKADSVREIADGSSMKAEADRHPDPIAEAVRWSICEGELVQIIGRGRGVNRTAATPLDVFVMTDTPLPMPLARTVTADDLAPTVQAEQLAAGGIAFESPTAAAAAYPDLWPSAAAAKMAWRRERSVTSPYREYLYGKVTHLARVIYQLIGAGKAPTVAYFDPAMIEDPAAAIAARLGPVKWVKVEQPEALVIQSPAPGPIVVPRVTPPAYIVMSQKKPLWIIQPAVGGVDTARGAFARLILDQSQSRAA